MISRNSAFVYKGKPINAQSVANELGVPYVVEGSVRRAVLREGAIAAALTESARLSPPHSSRQRVLPFPAYFPEWLRVRRSASRRSRRRLGRHQRSGGSR